MSRVSRTGDNDELGPLSANGGNQIIDFRPHVHGDYNGLGVGQTAARQKLRILAIAEVDRLAIEPGLPDELGRSLGDDVLDAMTAQHFCNQFSHTPISNDDSLSVHLR